MIVEGIIIGSVSFLAGLLFKAYCTKKDEGRWRKEIREAQDDRHHFIYRWNVATCRLGGIQHMAKLALEGDGDGGPYRADPSKLVEALERIRDRTEESLKEVCREVGCFKTLEEAGRYAEDHTGDSYPIIVRHEEWDGVCWHVIYGSDVVKTDVDRALDDIRRGCPVNMVEALDAIRAHEMDKKHGHRPLLTDVFKLSGIAPDPERMKYSVDQETGVVTIEYEAVDTNPCRQCETGRPEPQCDGNCVNADEVEPTEIPPPGMRMLST